MKYQALLLSFFLLFTGSSFSQDNYRIMFYNVENLFDTIDDPQTQDDEFTPNGSRYWTAYRYYQKLTNIAKVISSVGEWDTPVLVGLCEVENEKVLEDLTKHSPLRKIAYRYVMADTEDIRGIRVALLYERDKFRLIEKRSIKIEKLKTRDILHVSGYVATGDTLDTFICHFPSRRLGKRESEPNRVLAASILRQQVDSILDVRLDPKIIIMGDFNDEPSDKSISKILNAQLPDSLPQVNNLYNLSLSSDQSRSGTYKYQGEWNVLDQIIVSGSLLDPKSQLRVLHPQTINPRFPYLLTEDPVHDNLRPLKTYHGYRYEGGFSDHLPIYINLFLEFPK
ncbi:endonuclease/exonuclease/phosphatase family protein [Bacteroidales bacterium OttesenSCG-928-M11]|nr:endonuclease/exonuclease/phosphatase family protein [Bacteroidales bacterium OttesenSCG-928-M11]